MPGDCEEWPAKYTLTARAPRLPQWRCRSAVVPNDQIDLFIRGSPENSLDQLRYRCVIGPGTEGKQDGHQKQQRQEQQKQNAPGLIFAIVRQLVLTHQW